MYAKHALWALLAVGIAAHAEPPAAQPAPAKQSSAAAVPPAAPVPAVAQAPKPSREAQEIAEINERLAVMAARLAELEMEAKIAAKRSEISRASALGYDDLFVPSVREISGIDGKVWAVLNVQGGNTQTVRVGDKVGGWRVVSIGGGSVMVQKGKETLRLSFGANAPQPQSATAPGGLPPYPGR